MPDLSSLLEPSTRLIILLSALGFIGLEYLLSRLAHLEHETHDLRETAASLGIAIGQKIIRGFEATIFALPFAYCYEHRWFNFEQTTPTALVFLFLSTEFVYYWHHRASHRIRWLWATHSVHHSATRLNLSAAIRLGWTGGISGNFLFYLPMAWLGFHPFAIIGMLLVNLLYQFFIHTELAPRLGIFEWVLNTPAHHRVHHASNEPCLDRNYGGILILFDRLFGTFTLAPTTEALRYGLVGRHATSNPLKIAFGEWAEMFRDLRQATRLGEAFKILFGPPRSASVRNIENKPGS